MEANFLERAQVVLGFWQESRHKPGCGTNPPLPLALKHLHKSSQHGTTEELKGSEDGVRMSLEFQGTIPAQTSANTRSQKDDQFVRQNAYFVLSDELPQGILFLISYTHHT